MKKAVLALAVVGVLVPTSSTALASTPDYLPSVIQHHPVSLYHSNDFGMQKPIPEQLLAEVQSHAIKGNFLSSGSNGFASPESVSLNWNYENVDPNNYIDSRAPYWTVTATQDVKITFVQYPSAGESGTAWGAYQLIPKSQDAEASSTYSKWGNFTSTNTSLTFTSVPPGDYSLRIYNWGAQRQDGNGFTYYH